MRRVPTPPDPPAPAACERCAAPRPEGRVPWCAGCLALLAESRRSLRPAYRRDYQRAYQRSRRSGIGPARLRWEIEIEGRVVRVVLRRYDGVVVLSGPHDRLDATIRFAVDALGAAEDTVETSASGGGRGGRRQSRFRIEAPLGEHGEVGLRVAMERAGVSDA